MDNRIIDIVTEQYLVNKNQIELELEFLINNAYQISVEEKKERIMSNITKLSGVIHDIQMWENITNQIKPQTPEEENNK